VYASPVRPPASRLRALLPALLWIVTITGFVTAPPSPLPALAHEGSGVPAADRAVQDAWARAAREPVGSRVPELRPPVDGPLVRGFEELAGPFGPGHRGVDFGAVPGAPVRAPAGGRVTFAGQVAGTTWLTVEVAPAVLVTLGPLRSLGSSVGQTATTGDRLGTLASGHASADPSVAALHLGLRVDGIYVDPLPWLAGLARPRLAPLSKPGGPR
jgi:murein DD-endopeptidase MepM/ murein hydrolase activator NlpD